MKKHYLPFALALFLAASFTLNAQWTSLGSDITTPNRTLANVFPVTENIIWGFTWPTDGFYPTHEITRTTDGGETWFPGTLNGVASEQFPIYLFPLDDQTAWLATADEAVPIISGHIYKTTDGGSTWVHQTSGFTGFNETPAGIWFWNENEGLAFGATCNGSNNDQIAIYTTDDGGENWSKVVAPDMPTQLPKEGMCVWNLTGFFSVVGDNVWFGTDKARVFRSTDRGHTWEAFSTDFANDTSVSSIQFKDSQNGLALSLSPFGITRTMDSGENWNLLPGNFPSDYWGSEIEYIPGTNGTYFVVPSSDKYLVSRNDGDDWETFDSNIDAWGVQFLDATTGFAGSYTTNPTLASAFKWTDSPLGNRLFVNDDAAGANNGTSWTDAFNDLQDALAIAVEGDQIWVAGGTYLPGSDPTATFLLTINIQLYGGFDGTETALDERDNPADHPTILSGDLNGDDVDDDFINSKSDNVMTVLTVDETVKNNALLDGFTVKGGHADGGSPAEAGSGGGIYCSGKLTVRECVFEQNFAITNGGAMYITGSGAEGGLIEQCKFEKNRVSNGDNSTTHGGAIYLSLVKGEGYQINGSSFDSNFGGWAGGLHILNSTVILEGDSFTGNHTERHGGGIRYRINGTETDLSLVINNCLFENNEASFGGGMYVFSEGENISVEVTNSEFIGNDGVLQGLPGWDAGSGGVSYNAGGGATNSSFYVDNCLFSANQSTYYDGGLGVSLFGDGDQVVIKNSEFTGNTAGFESSAMEVWGSQGGNGTVLIDSCTFQNNISDLRATVGLSCGYAGPPADYDITLSNSLLQSNQATEGGALLLWNDLGSKSNITIDNCSILDNTASISGGAMRIIDDSPDFQVNIKRTVIAGNQSPDGSAIATSLTMEDNVNVFIENSLIAENGNSTSALSIASTPDLRLLNCTVADNESTGIVLAGESGLTLQNNILFNPGNLEIEDITSDAIVTSHGGNLIGDGSLDENNTDDLENENPGYDSDYMPIEGGNLVGAGINDGVTSLFDLAGNDRIQHVTVDIGAFESPYPGVTFAPEVIVGEIQLSPNPATDYLNLELPASITEPIEISLFDPQERLMKLQFVSNGQQINVADLPSGFYSLKLAVGEKVYVGKFIKQ